MLALFQAVEKGDDPVPMARMYSVQVIDHEKRRGLTVDKGDHGLWVVWAGLDVGKPGRENRAGVAEFVHC